MEQALAYVCCSAEESRVKVQKYCRKIYELGYVPILSLIHISGKCCCFLPAWCRKEPEEVRCRDQRESASLSTQITAAG